MSNFQALVHATLETLYMVFMASFLSLSSGLLLGCVLFYLSISKFNIRNKLIYSSLGLAVNSIRSIPFIILIICLIPLTRFLIHTSIGTNAAIIALTIAATPFFARICQNALAEVSPGLHDVARVMGASTLQLFTKILLPESMPNLVRGATLTIITIIGYSSMAGVIGGGGLGELAINYGYQRFDTVVMLETVLVLLAMVGCVQLAGDKLAQARSVKFIAIISCIMAVGLLSYQLFPATTISQQPIIRVGVMSGWSQDVMAVAQNIAKERYDINLQISVFNDYVQPNTALVNGSLDANIFQHLPYLEAQIQQRNYHLISIGKTFVYPMGFYSNSLKTIWDLKKNAIIAIPNDPSNAARALLLLQKFKLIKLRQGGNHLSDVKDIVSNPYQLKFKSLDAAQLPRVLQDAALVAITNDFLNAVNLTVNNAILKEGSDSLYANIIVVRAEDKNSEALEKLVTIMHSPEVKTVTEKLFPAGGAIAAW